MRRATRRNSFALRRHFPTAFPFPSLAGGAILGHCVATGMAVLGGSFISRYLSERVIGIVGGVLFLVFALTTALGLY